MCGLMADGGEPLVCNPEWGHGILDLCTSVGRWNPDSEWMKVHTPLYGCRGNNYKFPSVLFTPPNVNSGCILVSLMEPLKILKHPKPITPDSPAMGVCIRRCLRAKLLQLGLTLCNPMACQSPLRMGFSRQEYWSGLSCFPPGDLPNQGSTEPKSLWSPALAGGFFTSSTTWEVPRCWSIFI